MSTTAQLSRRSTTAAPARPRAVRARHFVGGFYLVMGGVNAGIVAADPQTYATFADGSFSSFVTRTWHEVVMAQPYFWFLALAAGEVALGLLLLRGGTAARVGWVGVITFHVLLMSFGFGFWLWCLPALALLVSAAHADWPALGEARRDRPPAGGSLPHVPVASGSGVVPAVGRSHVMFWSTMALSVAVVASSLYGLLADAPYRSLPATTVLAARAQDACSIAVALVLVVIVARAPLGTAAELLRLGLLGYLLYSYLIYVSGVPMNRMFLVYVAIVVLAASGLAVGIVEVIERPPTSQASRRLETGTGWFLIVTAVVFAGLWLSMLLPVAIKGGSPATEGVGGTPYPVFWLDLAITLPAIAAVGTTLVMRRQAGPPLAVVALVKIVTLFTALWAGPVVAVATGSEVHLGPDAGPSLVLLAVSSWLSLRWLRSFPSDEDRIPGTNGPDAGEPVRRTVGAWTKR